jgi:hypothetical protein
LLASPPAAQRTIASVALTRSKSSSIFPAGKARPFPAGPEGYYRVVAGAGAAGVVTGAAGRVTLPVVVPGDLLLAVPLCEPFHGPHMNRAPTISTAATIAATMPPLMPLPRSSSRFRVFRSFCIVLILQMYEREKHAGIIFVPRKAPRPARQEYISVVFEALRRSSWPASMALQPPRPTAFGMTGWCPSAELDDAFR